MDAVSLIKLLSDGEFHSGSQLGEALGVSRTAIWKALAQLEQYGLVVESVKGKGYRLAAALELLDEAGILSAVLESRRDHLALALFDQVDSTNTVAMSADSEAPFNVVLAEMQTKGRGRRGRVWQSPFAKNIYLSLAFELKGGPDSIAGLSLVAGLSVIRAISRFADLPLKLKWPNDVMVEGKKLAGLLVELQGEPSTAWKVVLGLGLNVSMSEQEAQQIDQPWCNLADFFEVSRNQLAGAIVDCLVQDLARFSEQGFAGFASQWSSYDYFKGQEVVVLGSDLSGYSEGVDLSGNLLLRSGDELKTINAGEVSVRPRDALN